MAGRSRMLGWTDGRRPEVRQDSLSGIVGWRPQSFWLDVTDPTPEDLESLSQAYRLHPVHWESFSETLLPQVGVFPAYVFVGWFVLPERTGKDAEPQQVFLFLGANFLVTVSQSAIRALDTLWDDCAASGDNGADCGCWRLFYRILDAAVDGAFPHLEAIATNIDDLEERIFTRPGRDELTAIRDVKRENVTLRKILFFERENVNQLMQRETEILNADALLYLRDLHSTLLYLSDMLDTHRDMLSGAMDLHLSAVSNRLNDVMKRLTVISTIFLPLTFLTGVYGMNFRHMPELAWRYGYLGVWLVMSSIGVSMLFWFKRKGWF
ncbi:MAG: magnesium/cobalt transporter CorA [Candidatus Geothermincolia bacterium]